MTVELALLVSSDGIALVHRQPAGHWSFVGETAFDVPDLDKAMADLRRIGEERAGEGFATLLVLPDDQILYTSLTAPTDDAEMTAFRIEQGLEGMTPYAVSELVYDWRAIEADRVKLAVVARETLDEARAFAESHGFNPAGFAATPPQERFPGVPRFDLGGEASDLSLPDEGLAFGPDTWGMPEEDDDAEADDLLLEDDAAETPEPPSEAAPPLEPEAETPAAAAPENDKPEASDKPAAEPAPSDVSGKDPEQTAATAEAPAGPAAAPTA
ncbi:MAG: translation initiation factor 2, partial [Roseicyclus sp.]